MRYSLSILLLLIVNVSFTQEFNSDSLSFNGLKMWSTKSEIINVLGQPDRIYEPNFECGFLSSDEQGKPFYAMVYENVVFVGNDKDKYVLDEIDLADGLTINYGNQELSNKSNLDRLIEVIGDKKFESLHDTSTDSRTLFNKGSDGGWRFTLENGRLVSIGFWSPC